MKKPLLLLAFLLTFLLTGCGYNKLQALDENIKASWSEVINQYQRRAQLLPNLMATVQGYAKHEQEIFTKITTAQQKIGAITINAQSLDNPEKIAKYQQAQGELSGALSRLIAVANRYPELQANTAFNNLMTQLEGTENRIATARQRYIDAVREYNTLVRQFPSNLTAKWLGLVPKPAFRVDNEQAITTPPKIQFNEQ